MKLTDRFKNAFDGFTNKNSVPVSQMPTSMMDFGRPTMRPEWTQTIMSDKDMYTGYMYGAINNRANGIVDLAADHIVTSANRQTTDSASRRDEELVHPYLNVIRKSPTFTEDQFWYVASTYLDLQGVFYVLALRNRGEFRGSERIGEVQEFKLLNPYQITPVYSEATKEIEGYVENRNGSVRELPPHMVIAIRRFNPFDNLKGYAPTDAAKDAQFTLKQSSDHTRQSIQHNVNSPGIIQTEVELAGQELENFRARIMGHAKGEPIFATGSSKALLWQDMQIDLDKAALGEIQRTSLDSIIAASGVSRTMFGIEQSGVTRDTASVQKDLLLANHVIPQARAIIGSLNQDYQNTYSTEYDRYGYEIIIDSPLKVDIESDTKSFELREKRADLYDSLVSKRYNPELAAQYASGEISVKELGEPEEAEPVPPTNTEENKSTKEVVKNQLSEDESVVIHDQQGALANSIQRTDDKLLGYAIQNEDKLTGDVTISDLVTQSQREETERELDMILSAFFTVIISSFGSVTMSRRLSEFGQVSTFSMDEVTREFINQNASKAAASHIDTVLGDMLKTAQEGALAGLTQREIVNELKNKFASQINTTRATTIARTETNRAFSMTQYEADRQFLAQTDQTNRAYKRWVINSTNPCPICIALSNQGLVPFTQPFATEGELLTATFTTEAGNTSVQKITAWEDADAGTIHPNCSCSYELVIN